MDDHNSKLEDSPKTKKILVVGDWGVDEHWVTGIHRSSTSSRTGGAHYRALQSPQATIQSFCGAGQTASILYSTKRGREHLFELVGIGAWNKNDIDILESMLNPLSAKGRTPHRIATSNHVNGTANNRIKLVNLCANVFSDKYDNLIGTNRYIRVYQHTGAKINLIQRIDWEMQIPDGKSEWITEKDENALEVSHISKIVNDTEFDYIVVKDLCKGVVSSTLIKWLNKKFSKIPWYISSKEWCPDWFNELNEAEVKLIMIPQVAAHLAINRGFINCWTTRSGNASKEALEEMDNIYKRFNSKPIIVALPDGSAVLARHEKDDVIKGIIQTKVKPNAFTVGVAMASVFFPSIIANMISEGDDNLEGILKNSMDFTQKWRCFEVERVEKYDTWDPGKEPILNLDSNRKSSVVGSWNTFFWEDDLGKWGKAFASENNGVITDKDGKKKLELWRSMTEVGGYVCCMKSKREVLQKLTKEFSNYNVQGRRRHKSCMLIARPGSGKSYLVRCLAKSLGLRLLSFNITQMLSKSDILDCFDTIITTQAQNKDEAILVFIDEVNAMLENQHVYDTFLAPLEEGIYVRAGKTFSIDPCVWIFAGTESPKTQEPNRDKSTKASDFISRLTLKTLDLTINASNLSTTEEARLEKVYLGVSLLQSTYPDIRKVSQNVLNLFHILNPEFEVREVAHLVKSFVNIQYGEVTSSNVPEGWLKEHTNAGLDITPWKKAENGEMIEII